MSEQKVIEAIEIPDTAYVECPAIDKRLRRISDCAKCAHHRGLIERMHRVDLPFRARFLVNCIYPVGRAIFEAER